LPAAKPRARSSSAARQSARSESQFFAGLTLGMTSFLAEKPENFMSPARSLPKATTETRSFAVTA